jgi:hypothetical protein
MQNHAASPVCDLAIEVRVGLTTVVLNDLGVLRNRICIIPGKSDWIHRIFPLVAIVIIIVKSMERQQSLYPDATPDFR